MESFHLVAIVVLSVLNSLGNVKADCTDTGAPDFGFRTIRNIGSDIRSGTKVKYHCREGYDLVGSPVSICKDNGQWSLPIPQCISNCPAVSAPANGEVMGKSSKYGMVSKFFCDNGFSLVGASMVTCKGGEWSHPTPTCMANCDDPGFPGNSERFTEGFDHGDSVRFSCDPGYDMIGSNTITCQNGQWSHVLPSCVTQ